MNRKAKGIRLEREFVKFCRDHGCVAMRAPASLGIDVIVIARGIPYGAEVTCERGKRRKKLAALRKACSKAGLLPLWVSPAKNRAGFVVEHLYIEQKK
ncbi:hypothetical protein J7L13_02425 [bacterium]|nr:hypothetical protein [bacterium]